MIAVLSPAKSLRETEFAIETTVPRFVRDAGKLVSLLKQKDVSELMELMDISEKLAVLNHDRFRRFSHAPRYPAGWLMHGDVYIGLNIDDFTAKDIAFADDHIRILSGLYGLLRLRDEVRPYRLEMGTRLATDKGKTLYDFWGHRIRKELLKSPGADLIVNLASQEYSRVLDLTTIDAPVLTVEFKEVRGGKLQMIPLYSKIARGMMARFMVKTRAESKEALKDFDYEGYGFNKALSDEWTYVFTRKS